MLSQIQHERYTQFSRTRTSLKKVGLEKLLFPLVTFKRGNLSVKPYKLYFVQLCLELSEHNLPMIVRNSNQFNGSLSTVILENINTISVVSGDNESTPSTKRGIDA